MKKKNIKHLLIMLLAVFTIAVVPSCRNASQAKQAAKIAKKLCGRTIKTVEKNKYVLQYGDDVIRHLEFEKTQCTTCYGRGVDYYGYTCSECGGDGYVYKVKMK